MFVLTEEQLLRLWRINQFDVPKDRCVFFGLRGSLPVNDEDFSFARSHTVQVAAVDHLHPRCTLGQWQPGKGFALFPGSTVPHRKYVAESQPLGGRGTNQLLAGCYADYRKGMHKAGTETGHDAFRQDNKLPIQRTADDLDFDADDRVDFEQPFDNLHAAWSQGVNHDSFASAGCQVIVGFPQCKRLGDRPGTGAWQAFKDSAYALAQTSFTYVLLTGLDAERVVHATGPDVPRLRYGSSGPLVTVVQQALRARGFYEGNLDEDFGIRTLRAVLAFQTQTFGPQSDDGIVGKQTAAALGIEWPTSTTNIGLAAPAPAPATKPKAAAAPAKIRLDGDHALTPDGVRFAKRFRKGVFTLGSTSIARFVQGNRGSFPGISHSLLNVIEAVSENEGNLEAVNTWDDSFLTFGAFQWSAGAKDARGELGALLARLKREQPQTFDEFFGRHGLDVRDSSSAPGITPVANFALDGTLLDSAKKKERLRTLDWAYRFWLAGHDDTVRIVETKQAMDRIDIFYRSPRHKIDGRFIADYVTSELGVALLLDQHVNRPGHVPKTIAAAVAAMPRSRPPEAWTDADERAMLDRYVELRAETSMTSSDKRAQVVLDAVSRGTISAQRGSFAA